MFEIYVQKVCMENTYEFYEKKKCHLKYSTAL